MRSSVLKDSLDRLVLKEKGIVTLKKIACLKHLYPFCSLAFEAIYKVEIKLF